MYAYTDKALAELNRQMQRKFRRLNLLDFDELNVVNEVKTAYRQIGNLAKKTYLTVGIHAYLFALNEAVKAGYDVEIPGADETPIDSDWVQDMLMEADEVTLYSYFPEWERKRQRLIEALAATTTPRKTLKTAMGLAYLQVSHYADKSTAQAAVKAYKDAGVKRVMWQTEDDEKVCKICGPLDGLVFDLNDAPPLQHYRCRCRLVPIE